MVARPGRPPKQQKRDGRKLLLNATRELISEEGIERLTLRAAAERAGVGSALVNYYFGNKEGLKEAVVEEAISDLRERVRMEELKGESAVDDLRRVVAKMIRELGEKPYVARMVVELILAGDDRILEKLVRNVALPNVELVRSIIERGEREGSLREEELQLSLPAIMGAAIYPLVIAPFIKAVLDLDLTDTRDLERYAAHTADLIIDGLQSRS